MPTRDALQTILGDFLLRAKLTAKPKDDSPGAVAESVDESARLATVAVEELLTKIGVACWGEPNSFNDLIDQCRTDIEGARLQGHALLKQHADEMRAFDERLAASRAAAKAAQVRSVK